MVIEIIKADYTNKEHAKDILMLLDEYASDPMGGGEPLAEASKNNLVQELARLDNAFSIIAYVDSKPAGLVNCLPSFSTFLCKPIVNIHDFMVAKEYRGMGLSQKMLAKVEEIARDRGCCKLTLEVLSNNEAARGAYGKYGFSSYTLDPGAGVALFWQKSLE